MLDESDSEEFPKFKTAMMRIVSARNADVAEDISKMSRPGFIAAMIAVCVNWREREPPGKATRKEFQSHFSNLIEKNPMAVVRIKSPIGPGWEPLTVKNMYIGPGWYPIIDRLVADLLKLGWDGEVLQVKEKFSTLRFYIDQSSEVLRDRIAMAEDEASRTCNRCGQSGSPRESQCEVLCDEHASGARTLRTW
jgi:hypothetical protein